MLFIRQTHQYLTVAARLNLILGAFALLVPMSVFSQTPAVDSVNLLTPAHQRYTSPAAKADLALLASTQNQLLAKNTQQTQSNDYLWAKAQRWLDIAQDEYRNNNRGSVPQQALGEALRLIPLLGTPLHDAMWETAALDAAPPIRADLHGRIKQYRLQVLNMQHPSHNAALCSAGSLAYAQVQLSWAAWVNTAYGWRSALPYIAHTEKMLQKADAQFNSCKVPYLSVAQPIAPAIKLEVEKSVPAQAMAPTAVPEVAAIVKALPPIALPTRVYFQHNRSALSLDAQANLNAVAALLKLHPDVTVMVEGYADDTGSLLVNQALSNKRAQTTAHYLLDQGIAKARLVANGVGTIHSDKPLKNKANPLNRRAQLLIQVPLDHPIRTQLQANQTAFVKSCPARKACP